MVSLLGAAKRKFFFQKTGNQCNEGPESDKLHDHFLCSMYLETPVW